MFKGSISGKRFYLVSVTVCILLILIVTQVVGYRLVYNKGVIISELISISYAPKDLESFKQAAIDSLEYINEEDVSALFVLRGEELTEYDLAKSVSIDMDLDWGIKPRLEYNILVSTPSGIVELIMHMDYGILGVGKVKDVVVYDITKN